MSEAIQAGDIGGVRWLQLAGAGATQEAAVTGALV